MQTPRSIRYIELMPSQRFGGPTSQLPHLIEFGFLDQVGCQAASALLLICFNHSGRLLGRRAVDFDLDLRRPVKPRWPNAGITERVNRQDAGLPAMGQGRAIAAARFVMPSFWHADPKRGTEWWGKDLLGGVRDFV